jgi:hypothetical protein
MSTRKKTQYEEPVSVETVVEEAADQPEQAEQAADQPVEEAQNTGPLIYCGPSLPGGLLRQHTVYRNGLPKYLEEHFKKCPALRQLFVPVEELSATTQAVQTAGSAESIYYAEVLKHFSGGVK